MSPREELELWQLSLSLGNCKGRKNSYDSCERHRKARCLGISLPMHGRGERKVIANAESSCPGLCKTALTSIKGPEQVGLDGDGLQDRRIGFGAQLPYQWRHQLQPLQNPPLMLILIFKFKVLSFTSLRQPSLRCTAALNAVGLRVSAISLASGLFPQASDRLLSGALQVWMLLA